MKPMQIKSNRIHFVGIGGCGMSGIADVLFSKGYQVTGSDVKENKTVVYLRNKGMQIFIGHAAENIAGADIVVLSSAIPETNPEVIAAKELKIPMMARAEMLAEVMDAQLGIAIAGTHGKTTTTSLTTTILMEAGLDPTFLIGGTLHQSGTNARLGEGAYCVAEADESDASFLFLNPSISIVTNIDMDHLWSYGCDFENLKKTFIEFLHRLPNDGLAVVCYDDEINRSILAEIKRPLMTYGFHPDADVQVCNYSQEKAQSRFQLKFKKDGKVLDVLLNLPGKHNALNTAAATIVAKHIGIADEPIKKALLGFSGVGRRFQIRGDYTLNDMTALVVDDYGHHPREIAATLEAARAAWPNRRVLLVFQPHRYTRTQTLFNDFADVLAKADQLILLDVYSAGEQPIEGATGLNLKQAIIDRGRGNIVFLPRDTRLNSVLPQVLQNDDIIIMQGAGDIGAMASELVP